ncbi:hypothetical protein Trydic_g18029 [Trypoxylus dichotomus]
MPPVGSKRKAEDSLSDNDSSDSSVKKNEVMEIESEDEIDWDNINKIIKVPPKTKKITGFHLMPTCLPQPRVKEEKQVLLNKSVKDSLAEYFKVNWDGNKSFDNEHFEIITKPWKACVIKNLLDDDTILKDVRQEFYELNWNKRRLDLYNFHQSVDLKHLQLRNINLIYDFFKNDLMSLVSKLMNFELTHISATCSFYADTDYLLVHDDQQDDRVVAFVLYFSDVQDWCESWGGALQLFNCDDNYQPSVVERSISPRNNQLVLFPVSPISYHQVEEIKKKNFSRYSINGWFHGKTVPSSILPTYKRRNEPVINIIVSDIDLNEFINPIYLDQENIVDIQSQIETSSEISLLSYFKDDFYDQINDALESSELKWKFVGPSNRCCYEVLEEYTKFEPIQILLQIFQSEVMLRLLKSYTDLELVGQMKYEIQRWSAGCYSLFNDSKTSEYAELELVMYFGCEKIVGGNIQYVDREEEVQTALVTLEKTSNTLNIIYTDTDRINHYVSKYTEDPFYILLCKYNETAIK